MAAVRVACVCASLAASLSLVFAACNDPLSQLTSGPGGHEGEGGVIGEDGAALEDGGVPASEDASSSYVDVGPLDAALPFNAVDAADIPEGGLHVQPGVITCGGSTCNAFAGNQCCTGDDGGACLSTAVACGFGGSMTCDESADCLVGTACCATLAFGDGGAGPFLSSSCAATCTIQLCRTSGECGDAGPCVAQTCSDGLRYEMCGVLASADDGGFTCTPD